MYILYRIYNIAGIGFQGMLKFACNWHYKLQNVSSKILDYPSPRQNQISCRFFVSFFIPLIKKNYYSFFFLVEKNIITVPTGPSILFLG